MDFPFEQIEKNGKLVRTFRTDVDSDELKWHQDLKDRKVKIIKSGGWLFQMEDELPNKMINDETIFIPKLAWHRVIKGDGKLVVEIEEF
jgi:hypothetical protein